MEKNKLIDGLSSNDDQKILLRHIYDLATRCIERNIICHSSFLSESEAMVSEKMCSGISGCNYFLYGGYAEAERKCVVFLPDYYTCEDVFSDPSLADICYVNVSVSKFDASRADISHRDVLGSLMGLGIERSSVGDIIASGNEAVFVLKKRLADFVKENLTKVSKYSVDVKIFDFYELVPKQDYIEDSDTVASMRLDAVVSSVFFVSRGSAAEYITSSSVTVNGVFVSKPDMTVNEGDKLTLRGKGKAQILKLDGLSKKGRIRFKFRIYK